MESYESTKAKLAEWKAETVRKWGPGDNTDQRLGTGYGVRGDNSSYEPGNGSRSSGGGAGERPQRAQEARLEPVQATMGYGGNREDKGSGSVRHVTPPRMCKLTPRPKLV